MSTVLATPAQAPGSIRHGNTEERWEAALTRANAAGVKVYELAPGRYAVTSAHQLNKAYEVTIKHLSSQLTKIETCSCPAALGGDPICLHRAAVRDHLRPQPEPPAHGAYDPTEEALQWAYNDRNRAYKDLERFTERINRGDALTDREFLAFEFAQEREIEASERIAELKAQKNAIVAA